MSQKPITCAQSDELRSTLRPLGSITNWIQGEVLNPELPAIIATTWGLEDGTEVMRDEIDEHGCRHWQVTR